MAKNGNNRDVIELWGHDLKRVRDGLDEEQVVSLVNELISERDLLTQQVGHLSSLTKLAEKTVIEAERLAEEIKKEALDQTKDEATTIIAKAEEQARQMIEEKRTEILTTAIEEARVIKANAEREAGLLMERERERVQPEIRDAAQRLYRELLSQLENLKQQVVALEVESEHKFSQPAEQANTVTIEEAPLSAASQDKPNYEDEVELEILPPIDVKQIMGIMRYLDSLAEVENTELIPLTDKPLIVVFLREPLPLIEILGPLPEVDGVKEVIAITDATHAEDQRRRIQITLSGNSVLDESKERPDSEVYRTLPS